MALSQAEKDIKAINRRLDVIVRKYGLDSAIYREVTKWFQGGDAPKVIQSKKGGIRVSRGKENLKKGTQLSAIRRNIPSEREIKNISKSLKIAGKKASDDELYKRYKEATQGIDSVLGSLYDLSDDGYLSEADSNRFGEIRDVLRNPFNTRAEIVQAYEEGQRILSQYEGF